MNIEEIKARGILKMVKPIYNSFLKPFLTDLIKSKEKIQLEPNEKDVVIMLMERDGEIIVAAPVIGKDGKATRYIPLSDKTEAENLSVLIEKTINSKV